MQKVVVFIALIAITSCAAVSFTTSKLMTTKQIVEKCFNDEIANCPDKLCEMSSDNVYEILQQVKINVLACVESESK